MNQFAVELHSHTHHSDADFTVKELYKEAVDYGYDGLILTDHNTSSGYPELVELAAEGKLVTLKGIEWTTYFGHMLVHDADHLIDWRKATVDTIDQHIQEVKNANGLVGIAHPYAIGSPMCTGCHWSYEVKRWENVDYIEIWNSTCPDDQFWSLDAYTLWTGLLDNGYHISCSAGRDWHRLEGADRNPAVTYVETEGELTQETFRQALETGAFYITLGPRLHFQIEQNNQRFHMGDTIKSGLTEMSIQVLPEQLPALQQYRSRVKRVKIIQNGAVYLDVPISASSQSLTVDLKDGYIRVELWGEIKGKENELLVISNPIYIKHA